MSEKKGSRKHSPEFRISIAERMLAGENVAMLSREFDLPRSMMYRWRDAYRERGPSALSGSRGRPPSLASSGGLRTAGSGTEEQLRRRVAELERTIGRQSVQIDFFKGVFRRLEEVPKTSATGGKASTRKSGGQRSLKTKS